MGEACAKIHELFRDRHRFSFPYREDEIPDNGIYALFEEGEEAHGNDRIVRFGTHRGEGHLPGRIEEHFVTENKDRSIFRKNIGRALLNREDDPFLEDWNLDLTSRAMREKHEDRIDLEKQKQVEGQVTDCIQHNFSFSVLEVADAANRDQLESRLIATVSLCRACGPSESWLGRWSPKRKIRENGLWQEQHVRDRELAVETAEDFPGSGTSSG